MLCEFKCRMPSVPMDFGSQSPCRIWSCFYVSITSGQKAYFSLVVCSTFWMLRDFVVLSATTLGVALQTESNSFYFSCSPNMQSKFNYMLSNPLCYIFFHSLVLHEIHTFYVQRLLLNVQRPCKHLQLILP